MARNFAQATNGRALAEGDAPDDVLSALADMAGLCAEIAEAEQNFDDATNDTDAEFWMIAAMDAEARLTELDERIEADRRAREAAVAARRAAESRRALAAMRERRQAEAEAQRERDIAKGRHRPEYVPGSMFR